MRRSALKDSLLVFFFSTLLIGPLFRLKYLANWLSIESTFIADARMLDEHLPHPGWQPLWYCGTRFDYVYPLALRYGTALLAKTAHLTTARAYHLYTAICYVFGILAVYWLVRVGSRSRVAALFASAATALISPSFLLLPVIRHDSPFWIPQRLHVLMDYGEGPHISSLSVLGAALAVTLLTLRAWRPGAFCASAILCSLVVANNFYGATSLAIFFSVLVWSVWLGERANGVLYRAAGIAVLAYGLSAFWLTPSFIRLTLLDLKWVSQPGNTASTMATLLIALLFCTVTIRMKDLDWSRQWSVFVAGVAIFLSLDVLGFYYFGYRLMGEPPRLIPELDFALILAGTEIVRKLWTQRRLRIAAIALTALTFVPSFFYLQHAWSPFPRAGKVESQYEYKIARWVHENMPGTRVLPAGSVRFWFDAWSDNAQADGGSMQGMLNQTIPAATWQIERGLDPAHALHWLQALGTDAVIVSGKKSLDGYHSFDNEQKFSGWPVLFDDGHDTVIYKVERIHPTIGRIVKRSDIAGIGPLEAGSNLAAVAKYAALIEQDQPLTEVTWHGFDAVTVKATPSQGQSVLLQETFDPAWHAYEGGREIPIRKDSAMEFMLMDLPPGAHEINMKFETPLENRAGQVISLLSVLVVGLLMFRRQRDPATGAAKA